MPLIKNLTIDLNKIFIGFTHTTDQFNIIKQIKTLEQLKKIASREPGPHKRIKRAGATHIHIVALNKQ